MILPKENEESAKEEDEQVQGEASSIIDSTSSQSMPRRGEGTLQRNEELRRKQDNLRLMSCIKTML
jgi:hypothetical protein